MTENAIFNPKITNLPDGTLMMEVTGRDGVSIKDKVNPVWWAGNEWDKDVPDWYLPQRPLWWRRMMWFLRNPFHNLGRYVIGVGDKNYTVILTKPGETNDRGDLVGWEVGYILFPDGSRLPWYSYSSPGTATAYWGWQPAGFGGLKMNGWALLAAPLAPLLFAGLVGVRAVSAIRGN